MIQIRRNVFETNSSSVHMLVIPKDTTIKVPKKVFLQGGDYGWSHDTECSTINYMYQTCVDFGRETLDKFFEYLKRKGVEEIYAPELHWVKDNWGEWAKNNNGYVDHASELPLNELFANENLLDRFLFGDSWVDTGNDNDDCGPFLEDYDLDTYDVIEKGN